MATAAAWQREGRILSAATFALVLIPYATGALLPFRTGLHVQALGIVAVLALAAAGLWLSRRERPEPERAGPLPRVMRLALGLYLGAALLGTLVAFVRGNALAPLTGQALSMLFLPAAAGVAALAPQAVRHRVVTVALPAAAAAAALAHFAHWTVSALAGKPLQRLIFPGSISGGGAALAGILLALVWLRSGEKHARWALPVLAALALLVLGSAVRGLWLSLVPALLLYLVLSGELRSLPPRRWLAVAGVLGLLGLALAGALQAVGRPRPNLLPRLPATVATGGESASRITRWQTPRPPREVLPARPLARGGTFRLTVEAQGWGQERAWVAVRGQDAQGQPVAGLAVNVRAAPRWEQRSIVGALPPGTAAVSLEVGGGEQRGSWRLRTARLERLGPAWAEPVLAQLSYLHQRLRTLLPGREKNRRADPSVQFRLAESALVLGLFQKGSTGEKLVGHGLGATFEIDSFSAAGGARHAPVPTNYIHNFYLFLLFKLGILGAALALPALGLFGLAPLRAAWRCAPGPERRLLAALAAAWVGYALFAASSPELINFRVAPLLGLLVAAMPLAPLPDSRARPE